jgi:ABC-2 type transport system permease protein
VRKVWTIAVREYRAIVGTKAFLLVLMLMPVFMFGGIAVQTMLEGRVGPSQRTIVVLDATGVLFDDLSKAAEQRNENEIFDLTTHKQIKARFVLQRGPAGPVTEEVRYQLSERVRGHGNDAIDAFLEIPADLIRMPSGGEGPKVKFYAENAAVADERGWFEQKLSDAVRVCRLREAKIDPEVVARASTRVNVDSLGLVDRSQAGDFTKPRGSSIRETILVPFGVMMLMWLVIFLVTQPMLECVLEEKSQRIAEVLLGSANAFQLMAGKLIGGVAGSLTVVLIYGVGATGVAWYYDALDLIPLRVVPWFLVYQVLAVLMFGSLFMAVGAAVNERKEVQGLLMPVYLIMMIPLFVWFQIVRDPTGDFATWISFIPPATPLVMVLRIGASTAVPLWQVLAGIAVTLASTLVCLFAAARIFRIGILAQGKTPKIGELLRWAIRG